MPRAIYFLMLLVSVSLLNLGGGKDNGSALAQVTTATLQRGQLLSSPVKLGSFSVSDLLSKASGSKLGQRVLKLALSPVCSVDVYQLQYQTVGGRAEATTASAALMIPSGGSNWRCQGPRPIMLYAHGKRTLRSFNIADLANSSNEEGLVLAVSCAAYGYIVVAPNYAGYDTSTLAYHPYLNGDQQSSDMMDALAAARAALTATNIPDNHKLFVTGYSQGGYVALATHRALQAAGIAVTASAPMSGPYALTAFADAVFLGQVDGGATENFTMVASSYQEAYGNLYSNPTEIFEPRYAPGIETLLPNAMVASAVEAQGLLPSSALFSSTPPTPALAAITPARSPSSLAPVFAVGFGVDNLVTNAYRLGYLQDVQAWPDGGYPNTTTGWPPANPANGLRQALKKNDLRNWVPTAPVLLCGGHRDPAVFFLNTQLMQGFWAMQGPNTRVTVLDIDSNPAHQDPYKKLKREFALVKDLLELEGGWSAVLQDYHTVLVPAFCLQAVRSFFDQY